MGSARRLHGLAAFLAFVVSVSANAQIEPPSTFQEEVVDAQQDFDVPENEADAAAAQVDAASSGRRTGLSTAVARRVEEIVVQARRRDELLEETPIAVTALGDAELREHGVMRLDQIQQLVPNLVFESALTGQQVNIRIRGVGTSAPDINFDPGVGVYIDGVYLPRSFGMLIDVFDVEQIEVLRGPQGTLFGKNTVGGAINVRTVRPHGETEGFVMIRPKNFGGVDTRAMVNLPILEDRLYGRFAVASVNSRGFYENRFAGSYMNDPQNLSFLGSLRFEPTDDFTIDVFGSWSRQRNHGAGTQCLVVDEQPSLGPLLPSGFFDSCRQSAPFHGELDTIGLVDTESYGAWGIAEYRAGDLGWLEDVSVRGLMSWREQRPRARFDLDGTRFFAAQNSSTGGSPLDGVPGRQQQFNPELLVDGGALDDRIHFVLGAWGFFETALQGRTAVVLPETVGRIAFSRIDIDNWTWALFGQATADLTDWAALTAGVRFTQDKKSLTNPPEMSGDQRVSGRRVFDSWTPTASLALTVPDEWLGDAGVEYAMGYFTYAQGFKGGGFNALSVPVGTNTDQLSFEPETLDNFELGLKSIALDSKLTFNVAFFYGSYDDIQETSIRDFATPGGTPVIQRLTLNASEATTKGFEIESLARPLDGLLIQGNVGYTDAKYDDFGAGCIPGDTANNAGRQCAISDRTGQETDRSGESLRGTPKLQTFLALQYSFPLRPGGGEWLDGWLTPRVEWAYQSSIHWLGPEIPEATQRGWNALNARISYGFLDDRAQVALWARNLLDEANFSAATPIVSTFGVVTRVYEPPLTFGGELSVRF